MSAVLPPVDEPQTAIVVKETKSFFLTSEFWATVGLVLTALTGALPGGDNVAAYVTAAAVAAYAISRGLSKSGVESVEVAVPEA